jgi:acetyltransferase-like isoleucine patch superfamily enzyme
LRTFNIEKVNLQKLAAHFLNLGYKQKGDYDFASKKLTAMHFEHTDLTNPKVFISELRVEELSETSQAIIHKLVEQVEPDVTTQDNFLYSGTHWHISQADYRTLLAESEYAAWMAAWGYRANHFTVSVNHLSNINELSDVNQRLKDAGFTLNTSGGEIKGGEDVCLAQSSTMADSADVTFSDGVLSIPSCFYEFAQRYKLNSGEYYQGFVAASADKIFESTNSTAN